MTAKKKISARVMAMLLAVVLMLSAFPMSAFAAAASDLPDEMLDHPILRALAYTGYDVEQQIADGTLYQSGSYGSRTPSNILSGINYGTSTSGQETVADSSTVTGKAPDIARFQQYGLCCASFVSYFILNYLPNIEGVDTSYIQEAIDATGWNSQAVVTWQKALNNLADEGKVEKIGTSSSNVDRSKLAPGDIVIFGNSESSHVHAAIYSGTYNGVDFLIHVGNDRGPEISRIDWMGQAGDKSSWPVGYYHLPDDTFIDEGDIVANKTDTEGNPLPGAIFTVTDVVTGKVYKLGPTNASGTAKITVPYSTYKIVESTYPTNYRAHGETEWTVTLDKNSPNKTVSFTAVNELIPGDCEVIKHSEDGNVDGITIRITGNGVDQTGVTEGGKVLFTGLKPGTYEISEVVPENYEPQDSQTVTVVSGQTAKVTFSNTLKRGDLEVTKDAEDGMEEGTKLHLYGTSDAGIEINEYAVVDSSGKAYFKDIPIASRLILEEVDVPERYIVPDAQTVTIYWNEVTNAHFENILKRGDLLVRKDAEDGLPEGSRFHLYGTSDSGIEVDEYATADANGDVWFRNILMSTTEGLTLEEVNVASRYVIPDKQTVKVYWNEVTETTVKNVLKKWRADVFKLDAELAGYDGSIGMPEELMPMALSLESDETVANLGSPYGESQGDATLAGAVYGVFKGDTLVDTYVTDENGWFITDYYVCDYDWSIREITPSEGYLLDETVYYIDAYAENFSIELNTVYPDVYEQIIKGSIAIIKHTDDGSTKIETPEVGAEFEVFLKSAGSYENAEETERDYLVCDENGFDQTKDLPAGTYTVRQTAGWEGRELLPAFDVVINQDGEVYRYIINNANFESYLKITKTDATTGKVIPCAGTGFQLYDPEGNLITMTFTYPTPTTVDTFYTDENGILVTPEKLEYGKGYKLVEVQSSYGYVLNTEPVYFDITAENSSEENGITVINVTFSNEPQMGTVTITKTGEIFSSVVESDGVYQPVYEIKGVAGGVYSITAAEDIYTPDGTLRYSKGEIVATLTTGENGTATSDPLYLGKFEIREEQAPDTLVLNSEVIPVELEYAGQEVSITTTSASMYNERQQVEISLGKVLEQDEKFGIGMNGEIASVKFGLYAAEDLTAADGKVIPKDGLLEIAACDENGSITFKSDIPVGAKLYIKEYATNEQYILSDTAYPVTFEYAGQDVLVVRIAVNNGEVIGNDIIRGTVVGKKIDEDGFTIAGSTFGLFHPDTTEFTEETALMVSESNEIGVFGFEDVPYGKWIIRELKAAPAFVLNETVYEVTVAEHGEIIEITIENRFIVGSVTTTKVDAEYPDNKLSGAVFEVFADVNGNQEYDADIDLLVGDLTEVEAGVYVMDGLRYNGYFLHERVAPEFFLADDNYYYFEIRTDGEVVVVENEAGVGFINQPKTGEFVLTKSDITDGKLLPGVGFRIRNEAGEIVVEGYTDENGEFRATLRIGKYTYEEFAPLDGYIADTEQYPFEIKENGEIVKAEMTNEREPEPVIPDNPQTGDESNIGFWIGLAAVALGGIIATAIVLIKKKKDDENE